MFYKFIKRFIMSFCIVILLNLLMSTIIISAHENDFYNIANEKFGNENVIMDINSSKETVLDSILSKKEFTLDGTIVINGKKVNINDFYDFSDISRFDIASWLYKNGVLSYEEKIECFCDLILKKSFDNVYCLENIIDELYCYKEKNDETVASCSVKEKLENIFSINSNSFFGLSNFESLSSLQSPNFIIYYDATNINESRVQDVADYFEDIRQQFINYGFEIPLADGDGNKYRVILDYNSSGNVLGTCNKTNYNNNICSSYITIYNFCLLNNDIKETIVHEYFHAIQNAYNYQSGWLKEAFANWATTVICNAYYNTTSFMYEYIDELAEDSLPETEGYALTFFPITIENEYGGISTIKSIYEEYNEHSANIDFSELKNVVTNGIKNDGYISGSFEESYIKMVSYITCPYYWYDDYIDYGYPNGIPLVDSISVANNFSYYSNSYYSSKYFKINLPTNVSSHNLDLSVSFSGTGGRLQVYTISNNSHDISYYNNANNNSYDVEIENVGSDISSLYIIVSNVNDSGNLSYSIMVSYGSHDYINEYTWLDYSNHMASCTCGNSTTLGHIVSSSSFSSGERYAQCLLCHGSADIGFITLNKNKTLVNLNSNEYILPNGIIIVHYNYYLEENKKIFKEKK